MFGRECASVSVRVLELSQAPLERHPLRAQLVVEGRELAVALADERELAIDVLERLDRIRLRSSTSSVRCQRARRRSAAGTQLLLTRASGAVWTPR